MILADIVPSPKRSIDLTGKIFGRLKVLYYCGKNKRSSNVWVCECECGKIKVIETYALTKGITKSCGCLIREALLRANEAKNTKLREQMIGRKFNRLTVKSIAEPVNNRSQYICECSCGNVITVSGSSLITNNTQSCGCYNRDLTSKRILERAGDFRSSVIGKKFSRLTIIDYDGLTNLGKSKYKCQCDCGSVAIVSYNNLMSGSTVSCGCYARENASIVNRKHGMFGTRIYNIWATIIQRCENPNSENYEYYGGRNISMCPEWRNDFQIFYDWAMNNGYTEDLTIDRIDNDKGYNPDNCRWATWTVQARNKRKTVLNMDKANAIRKDPRSYREIANDYSTSMAVVGHIKRNETWKE